MPRNPLRTPRVRVLAPALAAAAAAVAALALGPGGPPAGSAADRFVAGQVSTVRDPVDGGRAEALRTAAAARRAAIGAGPAASVTVDHVRDRFAGLAFDEVTDHDARGRPLALQRFDPAGRLQAALRFGGHNPRTTALADADGARVAAARLARALGFAPAGSGRARQGAAGEWIVDWPRVVDGIPVPGDGLAVRVWPDGSLHAAVRHERQLAARPARLLAVDEALRLARPLLAGWLDARSAGEWQIDGASLAWVAPNDTFDAAAPDAPAAVLRLAWVVRVRTVGDLAGAIRDLELYLDAGDGRLLGGDIAR